MKKLICLMLVICFALVGCGGQEERPDISDSAIEKAVSLIEGYQEVNDAHISVKDGTLTLAIATQAITEDKAKQLGDNFARMLASQTANEEISAPTKDDLGGIYEYYDLQIVVGQNKDNVIAQGAKVTTSDKITW